MGSTFVMLKPDAVERGLIGEIVGRFEAKGLTIKAAELRTIDRELAETHYQEHKGKPFFEPIINFATRGPALLMILEGPDETWAIVRSLMGATDPAAAAAGTIRGDLASKNPENLVHGSDSDLSAKREIELFFPQR